VETPRPQPPAPVASTPPAPAPPAKPADLQQELQRLVTQYAAAIEARNLPAIQRVYTGMTPVQERGWQQFFQLVRDIRADLDITRLELANGTTGAQVAGTYSYLNTSSGRPERQPVSFHAVFRRDGGQWRIVQVR
jgi:ketosteroid isomerase-like protein